MTPSRTKCGAGGNAQVQKAADKRTACLNLTLLLAEDGGPPCSSCASSLWCETKPDSWTATSSGQIDAGHTPDGFPFEAGKLSGKLVSPDDLPFHV